MLELARHWSWLPRNWRVDDFARGEPIDKQFWQKHRPDFEGRAWRKPQESHPAIHEFEIKGEGRISENEKVSSEVSEQKHELDQEAEPIVAKRAK